MSRTALTLGHLLAGFRRLALARWAALGAGLGLGLLGGAAWAARLGWFGQPWWVLATWGVVGVAAVAVLVGVRRGLGALSLGWIAARLESEGFRLGALRAHLESAAPGTSAALLAHADELAAREVAARGPGLLEHTRERFRRGALTGAGALCLGLVLFGSAQPTHGRPALLWHPAMAWEATLAPLSVVLSETEVDRGARVVARVTAPGRQRAILWLRAPGESWRGQGLALDSSGVATTTLGPLEQDLFVRVTSGGRGSDTLAIRVRLPAFLGALTVTARYPRYLGLEDEALPTDGDTIIIPEGTRLETTGEATAPLAKAEWSAGTGGTALSVEGGRFQGAFQPSGTRQWELVLTAASGRALVGDTVRLPVVVVPDSAPRVEVPVPGRDTLVPLTLRVPLVIDAQDDHGLARVVVASRRVSRLGFEDPPREEVVALPEGVRDRAMLPYELDLNQRGLLPGDTVKFFVRVADNAPTPRQGRSREFVLRLPTLSEAREATRASTDEVGRRLDSIARASRQLERQTEDLAQERARSNAQQQPGTTDESLSFENAKRAENVAEAQEQLLREAEAVQEAIEALRQSAEAAGLNDPAWQERLREIQEQLERALTPELREQLAELQQALKDLDPERSREALERLAEAQERLREALERSRELFKRAALEGDMANLTAESRELAQEQQQWAEQVPLQDSTRAAAEEQALASRTDSLSTALEQLAAELGPENQPQQQAAEQAAEQAKQAASKMRQAAQSAKQGKKQEARRQGQEAAEQLEPIGDELEQQQESMQEEWREEVVRELDRALADASRLAERQLGVAETLRRGDASAAVRTEQGAIEEGVERLLDQMKDIAGKNALVGQQASVALATSRDNMRRAREALANAAPNPREAGRRAGEAVDALNAAAYGLLRSRSSVDGAGSGSGLQEAMQQMSQMAQQQGQMGQQAGGMLPMMGQGGQMQEQLRALGAQQRALAERLERMRAGGQIPGAAEMSQEAKDLARTLEAGRLDRQTVERQERLFRRMLDAGRTLQGQEEDQKQERQSTAPRNEDPRLPPALRQRLQGPDSALRVPTWEELQALSPEERRRVVDYFRRLAEQAGTGDQGPAPGADR